MTCLRTTQLLALAAALVAAVTAAPDAQQARQLARVAQSDAPLFERAHACQQLAIVGGEDAVPALAGLLNDEKLSHYAREALEAMPYAAAGAALRDALGTTSGPLLVGIVNSVGARRDAAATAALLRLAGDAASEAAGPALVALGRIGTGDAVRSLQETLTRGPEGLRNAAAEGCLLAADEQLARQKHKEAAALYESVRAANVSEPTLATATRGAIVAGGSAALPLLREQLSSANAAFREAALRAARELSNRDVTVALVAEFDQAAPAVQAQLIAALADRAERGDSHAYNAIEARTTASAEEARVAVVKALGRVGRASSIPLLVAILDRRPGTPEAAAAVASLGRVSGPGTDRAIEEAIKIASRNLLIQLIGVVADRKMETEVPRLKQLTILPDVALAHASWRALATIAQPTDERDLITLRLIAQDEEAQLLADRAIAATAMKVLEVHRRADEVLRVYRHTGSDQDRIRLLRPLAAIVRSMNGSHEAFFALQATLTGPAGPVREPVLRTLADWPDAAPSIALLELAARTDTPPTWKETALRGALRMADNVAIGRDRSPLAVLPFLAEARRLVRSREEKLMLVSALGHVQQAGALPLLQPYLEDPDVATEASLAVVQIAPALTKADDRALVQPLLEKIATSEKDADTKRKATRLAKADASTAKQKSPKSKTAKKAEPAHGPVVLFNGHDLTGWEGHPGVWRVREGVIVGGSMEGNPRNEFLATTASYKNFVLRFECRLVGTTGFINGGVQVRSVRLKQPAHEMFGYQADIGAGHSGKLYDESRRKKFLAEPPAGLVQNVEKPGDWNRYEVRCNGPEIEISLNGNKTISYRETDPNVAEEGLVALQIHGNCKAEIFFRNLTLEPLP